MITWGQRGKAAVLLDGQFGSTGKGQIAAWLALNACPDGVNIATTNAGAQAGHTTRFKGHEFICYHLPTVAVTRHEFMSSGPVAIAYINAGSIIDPEALGQELRSVQFPWDRTVIHPRAAVITAEHKAAERARGSSTEGLASTQKGVGAALADKIMRRAKLAGDHAVLGKWCDQYDLNAIMAQGGAVVTVEVPQGFGLSINHGWDYPACTSRDCYVNSALNDAGIHPSFLGRICMVVRTMPIRVGAIFNEMGEKVGDSGPFPPDSVELDWLLDLPGIEPERTTVTKRVRRIATWSDTLYRRACSFNRPDVVALTFCDYLNTPDQLHDLVERMLAIEVDLGLHSVQKLFSWGNRVEDVGSLSDALTYLDSRGVIR